MDTKPASSRFARPTTPNGWKELAAVALILAALVGFLHREVLFHGAVYHMDDAADNYYPARVAFRRALGEGTLPSWENDTMGGWPLIADPYYGYFYPLNVLFYVGTPKGPPGDTIGALAAGIPAGLGRSAALHAWLAGLGMFIFLRGRRLSFAASLFGAVSFALSSFLVVRIRHIIYVQMMAWVPFLLAAIERYIETGRRRLLAACTGCVGLLLLAGAHSLLHFVALVLAGYTVARLGRAAVEQPGPAVARLRWLLGATGALLGAALLGAMLAAVALLPTLRALPYTARALGTEYAFASTYAWPSWEYARLLLMPDLLGQGEWRPAPWFGQWNHWELAGYYPGALAMLLSPLGALLPRPTQPGRRWPKLDAERLVLLLLMVLAVLLALGDAGPLHRFFFQHVPLYAALRCPARALCIVVVAAPILAAHAAEWLFGAGSRLAASAGPTPPWQRLLGAALGLTIAAMVAYRATQLFAVASHLPLQQLFRLDGRAQLVAVVGGLAAVAALAFVGRLGGPLPLLLLGLIAAGDELRTDRGYLQPKPADFAPGTERFAAVDWLVGEMRAAPPERLSRFAPDGRGPFRLLSVGETLGIESASGYSSMLPWRYIQLLYILNNGQPYPFPRLRHDPAAAMLLRLSSPLVDMMNIRYLISFEQPSPKWVERFQPPPGARPHARYEPQWDGMLRVYENSDVMPRAYVAYQARLGPTEAAEAALVARPDFDPHREIVLGLSPPGGSGPLAPPAIENRGRNHRPARVVTHERHRVVIEADADADGVLVLADTCFPGWTATVDGTAAAIWPVNLAQRGIAVGPGHHRVELRYRARTLAWSAFLSLLGLLGLLGLATSRAGRAGR